MDAVIKVFCVHTEPNYSLPWQRKRQYASTSSGFMVCGPGGERWLLTNAHSVEYSSQARRAEPALNLGTCAQRLGSDPRLGAKQGAPAGSARSLQRAPAACGPAGRLAASGERRPLRTRTRRASLAWLGMFPEGAGRRSSVEGYVDVLLLSVPGCICCRVNW